MTVMTIDNFTHASAFSFDEMDFLVHNYVMTCLVQSITERQ